MSAFFVNTLIQMLLKVLAHSFKHVERVNGILAISVQMFFVIATEMGLYTNLPSSQESLAAQRHRGVPLRLGLGLRFGLYFLKRCDVFQSAAASAFSIFSI